MVLFEEFFDEPKQRRTRPTFNAKDKAHLYSEQKGKCNGCGIKFPVKNMTVDHIRPLAKGGSERPSNLQLLCNSCNSIKGDGTQTQLRRRLVAKGIIRAPAKSSSKTKSKSTSSKSRTPKRSVPRNRRPQARQPNPFDDFLDAFR